MSHCSVSRFFMACSEKQLKSRDFCRVLTFELTIHRARPASPAPLRFHKMGKSQRNPLTKRAICHRSNSWCCLSQLQEKGSSPSHPGQTEGHLYTLQMLVQMPCGHDKTFGGHQVKATSQESRLSVTQAKLPLDFPRKVLPQFHLPLKNSEPQLKTAWTQQEQQHKWTYWKFFQDWSTTLAKALLQKHQEMLGQVGKAQRELVPPFSSYNPMMIPLFFSISYDVWFHNNCLLFSLYLTAVCWERWKNKPNMLKPRETIHMQHIIAC